MSKAARVHAYARRTHRFGRVFMPIWIACAALLTLAAAADSAWHFGWGYKWQDALVGLGMIAFGFLFRIAWDWMFKIISYLNEVFYGPDPNREESHP
jgi:hypothetical protein